MELDSILKLGHDVYPLDCGDDEALYGFKVGEDEFIVSLITYPQRLIRIMDSDRNIIFDGNLDYIKSVIPTYEDNCVISIKLIINNDKSNKELVLK